MANPGCDDERDEKASSLALSRLFAKSSGLKVASGLKSAPRRGAHWLIRGYQLSLSMLIGRQCRHWPSCSDYADEAIQRFGLWRGGWVGFARMCRCTPLGTSGIDLVCEELPHAARWYRPWSYGRWRGVNAPPDAEFADASSAALDSDVDPAAGVGTRPPHP